MAYRLDNADIIIDGFQDGIADSPYEGIADMRNVNITSVPGEASVQFKQTSANIPPVLSNVSFTASASTDRLTWAGPNTLYDGCAISLNVTTNNIAALVVAGGGGGGDGLSGKPGGGGGAGGLLAFQSTLSVGAYTVTVGTGGLGNQGSSNGQNGGNSSFDSMTAIGGGGGAPGTSAGNGKDGSSGGSGGGGGPGTGSQGNGGAGTVGQGFAGGGTAASDLAGAGGGAGAIGQSAASMTPANGGIGAASTISGSSVTYAGGGGGGDGGLGGAGGGGNGGIGTTDAVQGTDGRGGGGGGGGSTVSHRVGADGGDGIVIVAYLTGTMTATGGTITTSGGYTIHTFTSSSTLTVSSVTPSNIFYVKNIVGTTFQISASPAGSIIDIQSDFSGTFTTYQLSGEVVSYVVDSKFQNGLANGIYFTDTAAKIWNISSIAQGTIPAYSIVFLGNTEGQAGSTISGINIWKNYIFLFGATGVDVAELDILFSGDGPSVWQYTWWNLLGGMQGLTSKIPTLVGQDGVLYFLTSTAVGSILENVNETFDPTDSNTYTRTTSALLFPSNDSPTCLCELGTNLLIGGRNSSVYPWDRVSPSFSYPIIVPELITWNIIGTNQNAYIFAGNRGRIYITNGSGIDEYKKIPDYVTGLVQPYFRWRDASFSRNQLFFSFDAISNSGSTQTTVNGAWAINLKDSALYMSNKITNTGYAGRTTMAVEFPQGNSASYPAGTGLCLSWNVSGAFGIDVGSSEPYQSLESFIETDMIPVGTFLKPFSPSQIEWKTSAPLGGNGTSETIRILYRKNITDSFTLIGSTTINSAPTETSQNVSDVYQANFQKAQWIQLRVEMSSNATTPTYNRLTELRIREFNVQT